MNIVLYNRISRCVGMADEGDSKSLVLITRVGSTPTTGMMKKHSDSLESGCFSFAITHSLPHFWILRSAIRYLQQPKLFAAVLANRAFKQSHFFGNLGFCHAINIPIVQHLSGLKWQRKDGGDDFSSLSAERQAFFQCCDTLHSIGHMCRPVQNRPDPERRG